MTAFRTFAFAFLVPVVLAACGASAEPEAPNEQIPRIVELHASDTLHPAADGSYTADVLVHFQMAPGRGIDRLHMKMSDPAFDAHFPVSGGQSLNEGEVRALFRFARPAGKDTLVVALSVLDTAGAESAPTLRTVAIEH